MSKNFKRFLLVLGMLVLLGAIAFVTLVIALPYSGTSTTRYCLDMDYSRVGECPARLEQREEWIRQGEIPYPYDVMHFDDSWLDGMPRDTYLLFMEFQSKRADEHAIANTPATREKILFTCQNCGRRDIGEWAVFPSGWLNENEYFTFGLDYQINMLSSVEAQEHFYNLFLPTINNYSDKLTAWLLDNPSPF